MKRAFGNWTITFILGLSCVLGLPALGRADAAARPAGGSRRVKDLISAAGVASHLAVQPGQAFDLAIDIRLAAGWYYYSFDPGPGVVPARLEIDSGPFAVQAVLWPSDEQYAVLVGSRQVVNNVYWDRAIIYIRLAAPDDIRPGPHAISVAVKGQICEEVCLTIADELPVAVEVSVGDSPAPNPAWSADPALPGGLLSARTADAHLADPQRLARARRPADSPLTVAAAGAELTLLGGLGLALLAGLLLNVMPCVLPVVPIRIVSLMELGGQSRRRFITLGLAFAGGIVAFFALLAAAGVAVRLSAGRTLAWSEHYQVPAVRAALALIMAALAANLFGLYTVTVPGWLSGMGSAGQAGGRGGHLTAGGWGLMMALLSTPCSFAILAGAMAWAQLQPVWLGASAVVAVGLGMAAPHAMLCAFPQLMKYLPRPGRWMELLRQSMGFPMLLLAVYLAATLSSGASQPFWVIGFGVVLVFCLWVWGAWVRYDAPLRRKLLLRGSAAVLAVGSGLFMLAPARPLAVKFAPFDAPAVVAARQSGKPVVIKFTAAWCISCHVIDYTVYDRPELAEALARNGVAAFVADVTDETSVSARFLKETFDRPIPLTVLYLAGRAEPVLFEGKFSADDLVQLLDGATEKP